MTELELYKFIHENGIEFHHEKNKNEMDVLIFPYVFQMDEFAKLVENCDFDYGIQCHLKGSYFSIWMGDICDYFGIEMKNVFGEPE